MFYSLKKGLACFLLILFFLFVPKISNAVVVLNNTDDSTFVGNNFNFNLDNSYGFTGKVKEVRFSYDDKGNSGDHFVGVAIVNTITHEAFYAFNPNVSQNCANTFLSQGTNEKQIVVLNEEWKWKKYPCSGEEELVFNPEHKYTIQAFRNQGGDDTQEFFGSPSLVPYFYIETTTSEIETNKSISSFVLDGFSGVIKEDEGVVLLQVPFGRDLNNLSPNVSHNGASIYPSTDEKQNFSDENVFYEVTALDGSKKKYMVKILLQCMDDTCETVELYSQKDFSKEIGKNTSATKIFEGNGETITKIEFAYNDKGNSGDHFVGLSVVDLTESVNNYGFNNLYSCGSVFPSLGTNQLEIVTLDSSFRYKTYPCETGEKLVLKKGHSYGISFFRNSGGMDTQVFMGDEKGNLYLVVEGIRPKEKIVNYGPTNINSDIQEDTVWTKEGSPYLLEKTINVYKNLRIEEGVEVRAMNISVALNIFGSLVVAGKENEEVLFTSFEDSYSGGWRGIFFEKDSVGDLDYAEIRRAGSVIFPFTYDANIANIGGDVLIKNSKILFSREKGIWNESGSLSLENVEVSNQIYGIFAIGGDLFLENNLIKETRTGITISPEVKKLKLLNNHFLNNELHIVLDLNIEEFFHEGNIFEGSNFNGFMLSNILDKDVVLENKNFPYFIQNYLIIQPGASLVLSKGVVIKFRYSDSFIDIRGSLIAKGEKDENVFFTFNLLNENKIPWGVLNFYEGSFGEFNFTTIEHGGNPGLSVMRKGAISNDGGDIKIKNSIITDSKSDYAIYQTSGKILIQNSDILKNRTGIFNSDNLTISNSNFSQNSEYAVVGTLESDTNAINNFWGDSSGPYHSTLNKNGKGDRVSDNVLFDPWLSKKVEVVEEIPDEDACEEDCFSNVMFFPGIQGSHLYGEILDCDTGLSWKPCGEEKTWISREEILHQFMELDKNGKSVNDVYTKNDTQKRIGDGQESGVVEEGLNVLNIYKSFMYDLRDWKEEGIFNDYHFVPYDWRLSLFDIVNNGKVFGENEENLSYNNSQDFSESFILQKLEELAEDSKTGKVTLVGHSKGGLVIKALLQKLKNTNHPLYTKIDKVILVASPQAGAPEAVVGLLHGVKLGYGFLMSAEMSRYLGENMPGLYALLPTVKYFEVVPQISTNNVLVTFEENTLFEKQIEKYGLLVNSFSELMDYLLGKEGRGKPAKEETKKPSIVNEFLLNQNNEIRSEVDMWVPEGDMKVIQIAGWGDETVSGIKYVKRNGKVDYKPVHTVDGDGTVVLPSALYFDEGERVENWWVDLERYNEENVDRDHKNILEIKNLRDLLKAKIKNENYIDIEKVVLEDGTHLISKLEKIIFTLHSPLTLGVYDEEGRYTGLKKNGEIVEEVERVKFRQIGEVKYLSLPKDRNYTLVLEGYEEGEYALDIEEMAGEEVVLERVFEFLKTTKDTKVVIDIKTDSKTEDLFLEIDYENDGVVDEIYPKVENEEEKKEDPIKEKIAASSQSNQAGMVSTPIVLASLNTETNSTTEESTVEEGEVLGEQNVTIENLDSAIQEEVTNVFKEYEEEKSKKLFEKKDKENVEEKETKSLVEIFEQEENKKDYTKTVVIVVSLMLVLFIIFKLFKVL